MVLKRLEVVIVILVLKHLLASVKKRLKDIKTSDLSFSIAPKINAAGRLDDIAIGIKCLISSNENEAEGYAKQLIAFNEQTKYVEKKMKDTALSSLSECIVKDNFTITMFDVNWHQGVIGILAARLKEKYYRPTIIFAKDDNNLLKGSGRSISSFHLKAQ